MTTLPIRISQADQPNGRLSWRKGVCQRKTAFNPVSNDEVLMKTPKQKSHQLMSVEISCHAPDALTVFLAGTFNAWAPNACPMKRAAEELWHVTLQLAPGTYEYKFLVDGEWVCEPGVDEPDPTLLSETDCVPNVYGTANRRLEVI